MEIDDALDYEIEWRGMAEARKRIEEVRLNTETRLDLSYLGLSTLPHEIVEITGLEGLYLRGNLFRSLPPEISQLTSLSEIDLYDNLFTEMPLEICQIATLRVLNFSRNRLASLPPEIRQLFRLERLSVSVNRLTSLAPEIGELKALTELTLYNNELESLPDTLKYLENLNTLYLEGNSALNLPDEVLGHKYYDGSNEKPNAAPSILNYYFANLQRAKEHGTLPLNEGKVIVLGEAQVGKSSLILALTEKMLNQPLQKTDGIAQKRWQVPLRAGQLAADGDDGDEALQVNLWDFGGQEVYKHTHTFFLTRRAVYLLVADARANERQNNLEYWLQMAASFGDAPSVWIAVNKCDVHGDGPDVHALMRKFPNLIKGFVRTSCWTGEGIDKLKETLVKAVLELDGVRRPINKVWLAIKHALETMKADVISTEDYRALCRLHGENEEEMPDKLLELWDTLGTVRYFQQQDDDPPEIRDSAILNPEWVTNAVYAVLDDKKVRDAGGLAVEEDFQRILKKAGYASERTRMIEHVMRRFDLLVDTPDYKPQHKMLVPQLLPEREPEHEWPATGTLDFIYNYPVLPAGLLPSFIARCYQRLSQKPGPWRHGCILEFPTEARARIIGDAEKKQVVISVTGEPSYARDALDAVRSIFDDMHDAVQGLIVEELIPVRGRIDVPPISYRFLRALEINGVPMTPHQGSTPTDVIMVDVCEALNKVRGKQRTESEQTIIINMGENTQNISGGHFNGNVANTQKFRDFYNAASGASQPELRRLLKELIDAAAVADAQLDSDTQEKLGNRIATLAEASKKEKVDKEQVHFSAKGIIEAAGTFPPVVAAVKAILSLFSIHIP